MPAARETRHRASANPAPVNGRSGPSAIFQKARSVRVGGRPPRASRMNRRFHGLSGPRACGSCGAPASKPMACRPRKLTGMCGARLQRGVEHVLVGLAETIGEAVDRQLAAAHLDADDIRATQRRQDLGQHFLPSLPKNAMHAHDADHAAIGVPGAAKTQLGIRADEKTPPAHAYRMILCDWGIHVVAHGDAASQPIFEKAPSRVHHNVGIKIENGIRLRPVEHAEHELRLVIREVGGCLQPAKEHGRAVWAVSIPTRHSWTWRPAAAQPGRGPR